MPILFLIFLAYLLIAGLVYFSIKVLLLSGLNIYIIGFAWIILALLSTTYLMLRGR